MQKVENSSSIKEVGYSVETKVMTILFSSGNAHRYFDVPAEVYQGFWAAESKGKYFGKEIRSKYKSEKVEEKQDEKDK